MRSADGTSALTFQPDHVYPIGFRATIVGANTNQSDSFTINVPAGMTIREHGGAATSIVTGVATILMVGSADLVKYDANSWLLFGAYFTI